MTESRAQKISRIRMRPRSVGTPRYRRDDGVGLSGRNPEELETGDFVEPESRVLAATPFVVQLTIRFGLELRMSVGDFRLRAAR